jgi:hypothetical protein
LTLDSDSSTIQSYEALEWDSEEEHDGHAKAAVADEKRGSISDG